LPVLFFGAKRALDTNVNNIVDWLPGTFDETARLYWFIERFGSDEILVISWPGCTLGDERLDRLAAALARPLTVGPSQPQWVLFDRVFTGRAMLEALTAPPLELTPEQALGRMRGWLVGPDGRTTCVVARIAPAGLVHRDAVVEGARQAALACGVAAEDIRLGGPIVDSVAIDQASQKDVVWLGALSALVGMLVTWACLRCLRLVAVVFLVATTAWGASLSLVYVSGSHMDAVLLMMPALVFVLAISGAVHLTGYYREVLAGQATRGLGDDIVRGALRRGWLPCTLASGTTVIGLGSLGLSHLRPVMKFGIFSAVGVAITWLALMVVWPAAMRWWVVDSAAGLPTGVARLAQRRWWWGLYWLARRGGRWVLACVLGAVPLFAYGVSQMRASVNLEDLLSGRCRVIRDHRWLQDQIAPVVPVEVVLRYPAADRLDPRVMFQRAQTVRRVAARLERLSHVGGTIAATTFAAELPDGEGARQFLARRVAGQRLVSHRDELVGLGYLRDDGDEELWRISARAASLQHVDYGALLRAMRRAVSSELVTADADGSRGVAVEICGGVPLVYMAQQQLLRDLVNSFLMAFALIAFAMVVQLRSILAGLIAMIPNVVPVLVVFGVMGISGSTVDIGTMMTASVALGIAVDDTLHLLVWYRRGLQAGTGSRHAVRFAFQHCATPVVQTSLICGLGLLVFVASGFVPISRFALVMATLLLAALLCDLVLLPALLLSRLGRAFRP